MTELRLLLKLQGLNIFRFNEIRFTQDKKQKRRLGGMLVVYIILGLMGIFYAAMMAWTLYRIGISTLLPVFALLLSSAACLMISVIRAPALLFNPTGWDSLLALPFHRRTLIGVKLISLYFSALSLSFTIVLPSAVFYFLSQGLNPYQSLVWLVILLFSPLAPIAFGIVLAAIPTLLLQRLKNRSLFSALLLLPLLTWLMLKVYTLPMDSLENIDLMRTFIQRLEVNLLSVYPPLGWILGAMQGNLLSLVLFLALNLSLMLAAGLSLIAFLAHLQQAMTSVKLRRSKQNKSYVMKPLWALTLKEARRIASSPLYLMNTGMVLWLTPMALFLLPFVKPGIIQTLIALPFMQELLARYLPLMACAMCALTVPATVSISIEGKNAWLMCTAPVSGGMIIFSKALFSVLFCLPPVLLTALLLTLHFRLGFWLSLICFLLPLSLCAFSSVIGLTLDLHFARFDWENEQQIIKNSAQTGLGILTGILSLAVLFLALHFAPQSSTIIISYILAGIIMLLTAFILNSLSKKTIYQIK